MVPLMIVTAIAYFINKANTKHSIYTKSLAEHADILTHELNDGNILRRMKLKYLLEKDFLILHPDDTPKERGLEIIHTDKNIFPVVDGKGILLGTMHSEELLEILVSKLEEAGAVPVTQLMHPPDDGININTPVTDVMQKMDEQNTFIFPVVSDEYEYKGFVSKAGILHKYRALMKRDSDFMQ